MDILTLLYKCDEANKNLFNKLNNVFQSTSGESEVKYLCDVIFLQDGKVTFATAEEFKKSKATDCIFLNYEITSTDHKRAPDIPKTLLRCSGVPKIKTHTLAWMFAFDNLPFIGDISQWDVSKVTDMSGLFYNSAFNGNISKWDVSSVTNMSCMFWDSQFNNNLLTWDVSKVTDMHYMFTCSQFNGNLSKWNVLSVTCMSGMFNSSKIKKKTVQSWGNFKNHNINKMF